MTAKETTRSPRRQFPSATEATTLGLVALSIFAVLLASLFISHATLVPASQRWDLQRIKSYLAISKIALEAQSRGAPDETSLQKLRDLDLHIDVFPPEKVIPEPNPRYVPALGCVEVWDVLNAVDGKPLAVLRLARFDIHTRRSIESIQLLTLTGMIGGLVILGVVMLVLRRKVFGRIEKFSDAIETSFAGGPGPAKNDPLDQLEHLIGEVRNANETTAARTRQLLDGHSELACLTATDGNLLEVNAAYCRLFGKTRDELVGTNYLDLIPPADRTDALNSLRKLSRRNPSNMVEHRVVLPDGGVHWTRWTDTALFGDDDTATAVLSFGKDITTEKNLVLRIEALQGAFSQTQSLAETGSLTWDFSSDHMEWTDETWRLLGLDKETCRPSLDNLLATVVVNDRVSLRELFDKARSNGDPFEYEFRCSLSDGSRRTLQSRAEVRADPQTKLLNRLTCTLRDITGLRDAEAATKRELRFREAVEQSLASGIVASDDEGRLLSVNPAFCTMTGWTEEELLGLQPPYPYWPAEEIPTIRQAFETTLGGQTPPEGYELRFCRKAGSRFDVLIKVAPLLDHEDHHLGWLASVADITSIQQTRRELLQAEATVREELRYRQAIEKSTTVGLVAIDQEGRAISVNEAFCKMLGYTREEILAMHPPYPFWPDEERDKIAKAFALHLANQTPPEGFTLRFKRKDGRLIDLLITAAPLYDAQDQRIGTLSALAEITPLQDAQRQLRTLNERLQIAQDVVEFGIWDWDPAQDQLFWDRQSFALFGYPEESNAESVWAAVLSEEQREILTYKLRRLITSGGTSGEDLLHVQWPDGSRHDISSTYLIMRDERGEALRVFGVNRDITGEMETERELRDTHERLAAALEGGRFGTFEHIIGQGDYNWNLANYEINGIEPSVTDPVELFSAWKKVTGQFFPQLMATMAALPASQNHHTYDFTAYPDNKEPRQVRVSLFIERNKQGHPVRLVGVTCRLD